MVLGTNHGAERCRDHIPPPPESNDPPPEEPSYWHHVGTGFALCFVPIVLAIAAVLSPLAFLGYLYAEYEKRAKGDGKKHAGHIGNPLEGIQKPLPPPPPPDYRRRPG